MTKSSKEKKIEPPPPIDTEPKDMSTLKNEVNAKQDGKNSKSRSKEKRGDDGKNPTGAAESRGDKEERRSKVLFQPKIMTEEEFRKDLLAWVKSVPLSDTSFTKIDRAFSDGGTNFKCHISTAYKPPNRYSHSSKLLQCSPSGRGH